jgi:hypothetical protein
METLDMLYSIHSRNSRYSEMLYIRLLQAALIAEYVTNIGGEEEEDELEFGEICPLLEYVVCPREFSRDLPAVPSWTDTEAFSELGLFSSLDDVMELSVLCENYDLAAFTVERLWPGFDRDRLYGLSADLFSKLGKCFSKCIQNPKSRESDRFFHVCFSGEIFGLDNGQTFVYREKPLTHLFTFVDYLKARYGPDVTVIGDVGSNELRNSVIQVNLVRPLTQKVTEFLGSGKFHNQFYFDTPFVKNSDKVQGNLETQRIRRTIVTTRIALPNIVGRSVIIPEKSKIIEYEPIEVACGQIRDRTMMLRDAIDQCDYSGIQQLLHGSLLAQVNEGPMRIMEVFLKESGSGNEEMDLKVSFAKFIEVMKEGVKFHDEWVAKNPEFVALQVQLENNLSVIEKRFCECSDHITD